MLTVKERDSTESSIPFISTTTKEDTERGNVTAATTLFFLGFPELGRLRTLLFNAILLTYGVTVLLDIVIIMLTSVTTSLHFSMYFFIKNFLFSELVLVTAIIPNMLHVLWLDGATMSINGCLTQSYVSLASESCECYLLAAMSYDRYLAICKPLHYNRIMNPRRQTLLAFLCWMFGCLLPLFTLGILVNVKFCGHNVIDHYVCDVAILINVACSDTSALQIDIFVTSFLIIILPIALVIMSYMIIFVVILRMSSVLGRKKAFSTCSTHLSVVGMFYGTLIINLCIPVRKHSIIINKIIVILAIVVTPLFNPIIYSLRNKDMRAIITGYIQLQKIRLQH